jgi:hypothetical protein
VAALFATLSKWGDNPIEAAAGRYKRVRNSDLPIHGTRRRHDRADRDDKRECVNRYVARLTDHHGIVTFSQRVNVPVGPSGPSSATRTTSRDPSSTDCVPAYPLRFVLVKPGETKCLLP